MEDLRALGLSSDEVSAYLALLRGDPAPPPAAATWHALEELGLVRRHGDRLRPTAPRPVLERWAVAREVEAQRAREAATLLAQLHEESTAAGSFVEVLTGREASRAVYVSLQSSAQRLVRAWDRGAYGVPAQPGAPQVTRDALARGITYQVIYDGSTLGTDGMLHVLVDSIQHGEEARIFPSLPMKMMISDDDRALIALSARDGDVDSILVHSSLLLDSLIALFTMIWDMAVPADGLPTDEPDERGAERHLLSMLSAGMTDAAIARTLGVSSRTVARRVGRLQDRLGAQSRFQLAALAARRGWL